VVYEMGKYNITTTAKDLTPATIVDYIDYRIVEMPKFQRNFVWDIERASKLIDSLFYNLPIPEVFLFANDDDNQTYKIIDGQQRVLTIYFYIKGKFPKSPKAFEQLDFDPSADPLVGRAGRIGNEEFFTEFRSTVSGKTFNELNQDEKVWFRLKRYLRSIVIRQHGKENDNQTMFEVFSRLNTGGLAFTEQEIRELLQKEGE